MDARRSPSLVLSHHAEDKFRLCLAKTQQLSIFGSRVAEFVQEHTLSLNLAMIA